MAEAELVLREPCSTDRRIQWVRATLEGLSRVGAAAAVHAANIDELGTRTLTAGELRTLVRLRERILAPARNSPPPRRVVPAEGE